MSLPQTAKAMAFIHTRDSVGAKAFYGDILGFALASEDQYGFEFDMHGVRLRITQIDDHVAHAHPVLGWEVDNIAAAVAALNAKGVTMLIYEGFGQDGLGVWTSPDGKTKLAWFKDPDANLLSLTQD